MSTYKEIRGLKVRDYTTNPDNPIEGQLWYNTTDNVAKYQIPSVLSSWSTTASLNQGRNALGGSGTSESAMANGGYPATATSTSQTLNELFNGSTWTESTDMTTARALHVSVGITNTANLAFGRYPSAANTENWNGSSWTEVADLNTARNQFAGSGTNTAALGFGGEPPPGVTALTESWNGK